VPDEPSEKKATDVSLRPRWMWIAFTLLALAIPLVGLWLERNR
jgi:hypothetical protein